MWIKVHLLFLRIIFEMRMFVNCRDISCNWTYWRFPSNSPWPNHSLVPVEPIQSSLFRKSAKQIALVNSGKLLSSSASASKIPKIDSAPRLGLFKATWTFPTVIPLPRIPSSSKILSKRFNWLFGDTHPLPGNNGLAWNAKASTSSSEKAEACHVKWCN